MIADVKRTVEQRSETFYETHIADRLALIHSTCNSSLLVMIVVNAFVKRDFIRNSCTTWIRLY